MEKEINKDINRDIKELKLAMKNQGAMLKDISETLAKQ
jgi:hypothetical protein